MSLSLNRILTKNQLLRSIAFSAFLAIWSVTLQPGVTHADSEASADRHQWSLSAAAGSGARGQKHDAYRAGLRRHWQWRWWQTNNFHFTGYWDLSLAQFDASDLSPGPQDFGEAKIWAAAIAPVIRWQFEPLPGTAIAPFLELGIGATYLSDDRLRSGKTRSLPLGSHFQFEDRGVIGLKLGQRWELAYQRTHYSNLDLASANHGIDTHLAMLSYYIR